MHSHQIEAQGLAPFSAWKTTVRRLTGLLSVVARERAVVAAVVMLELVALPVAVVSLVAVVLPPVASVALPMAARRQKNLPK